MDLEVKPLWYVNMYVIELLYVVALGIQVYLITN